MVVPVPLGLNGILNDIWWGRFDHPCGYNSIENFHISLLHYIKELILEDKSVLHMCKKYCENHVMLTLAMNDVHEWDMEEDGEEEKTLNALKEKLFEENIDANIAFHKRVYLQHDRLVRIMYGGDPEDDL